VEKSNYQTSKASSFPRGESGEDTGRATERRLSMQRGVSQLLFNYLPGRVVGWENGLAIVQIEAVRLSSVWDEGKAQPILNEIALWLDRWKGSGSTEQGGGEVDPWFPDPRHATGRFVVGEPEEVEARFFETALHCTNCSRLVFRRRAELERDGFLCRHCNRPTLRQFSQVLVHGCGELIPIKEFIPGMRKKPDGSFEAYSHPLRCSQCGKNDQLAMPARSERIRDIYIKCLRCDVAVLTRITGRCPRCVKRLIAEKKGAPPTGEAEQENNHEATAVARVAMRMTLYSASEAYYPHGITMLRLDSPAVLTEADPEVGFLRRFLPLGRQPRAEQGIGATLEELARQIRVAEQSGDREHANCIRERMSQVLQGGSTVASTEAEQDGLAGVLKDPDLPRAIEESIAFRTTVTLHPWQKLVQETGGAAHLNRDRIEQDMRRLGLCEIVLVENLPVISATFGYTRRAFTPTYEELSAAHLPTTIRPFPSLDRAAARSLGRLDLTGAVPILAREGKHEGVFLSFDPERVVRWVEKNQVALPFRGEEPIKRLLAALEPIDRYYDTIWKWPARRLIFGLVHSLSHALMRVASHHAGLERTSLSEYVLLPLLGTVVFDNSSAFTLGGIEMMMRDRLAGVLEDLEEDAMNCVFDVSCIDRNGACPGCLHSPEIACRVFNHGISRSFLIGGHAPWADVASEERIIGYWEIA
jgi:hypothetical protein